MFSLWCKERETVKCNVDNSIGCIFMLFLKIYLSFVYVYVCFSVCVQICLHLCRYQTSYRRSCMLRIELAYSQICPLEKELQVYLNGLIKSDIQSSVVGLLQAVSYQPWIVVCISCSSSCFHETLDKNNFRKKICHGS